MGYTDVPKPRLDAWYVNALQRTELFKDDWDAVRDVVLCENEYNRRGWKMPTLEHALMLLWLQDIWLASQDENVLKLSGYGSYPEFFN